MSYEVLTVPDQSQYGVGISLLHDKVKAILMVMSPCCEAVVHFSSVGMHCSQCDGWRIILMDEDLRTTKYTVWHRDEGWCATVPVRQWVARWLGVEPDDVRMAFRLED